VARLVLINGAPGSGKSTIAELLAQDHALDLALDLDVIKHSLGQWDADPTASGLHARRLALALVEAQLRSGHDAFVGQFLARDDFIDELGAAARACGAAFVEVVLRASAETLRGRLARRAVHPERIEHAANAALVGLDDIPEMITSIEAATQRRPSALVVNADGHIDETAQRIRDLLIT
jgi:predicted kinase